jgi:hypothetical protein
VRFKKNTGLPVGFSTAQGRMAMRPLFSVLQEYRYKLPIIFQIFYFSALIPGSRP